MTKKNYGAIDSENEGYSNELIAAETPKIETIELPNSNYLAIGIDIPELGKYRLKSVYMCWGKNTVIEVYK